MVSKVVAVEGRIVIINVGNKLIEVNQFEPIDLEELFTVEELQKSESLQESLRNEYIVEFTGQKLPKRPISKFVIPDMKVGRGPSSVNYKVIEHKRKGRESDYEIDIEIPKETMKLIKKAQNDRKRLLLQEKEELEKIQSEELKTDTMIKRGKADIPDIQTVRIDGKEAMPLKKFKAPKSGLRKVKENTVKVDLDEKTMKKIENKN